MQRCASPGPMCASPRSLRRTLLLYLRPEAPAAATAVSGRPASLSGRPASLSGCPASVSSKRRHPDANMRTRWRPAHEMQSGRAHGHAVRPRAAPLESHCAAAWRCTAAASPLASAVPQAETPASAAATGPVGLSIASEQEAAAAAAGTQADAVAVPVRGQGHSPPPPSAGGGTTTADVPGSPAAGPRLEGGRCEAGEPAE